MYILEIRNSIKSQNPLHEKGRHKAVISYLNHTVQFNHNPVMSAHSTAIIAPNHAGVLTVSLPAYLRKDQLICMQPCIPNVQVTDSVVQMHYTGKYQIAKLLVKNESGSL